VPRVLVRWVTIVLAASGLALVLWAQSSGTLVIQVNPEAHLSPSMAVLSFQVTTPGETIASTPVTLTAWVRSLPGQEIRLSARAVSLAGPTGTVAADAIQWIGTMESATAGATAATCTTGGFDQAPLQQLISGWSQSGIARCRVIFSLATQADWPAGAYTAEINFDLSSR
jgi:hypothetical protein